MLLALDHSLCNTGYVLATDSNIIKTGLYRRSTDKLCKHAVWVDIYNMAFELKSKLLEHPGVHSVIIESPNAARSEAAAASKFSVYALAGMLECERIFINYITARQAKAAAGLPNTKDKRLVIDAMYKKYGNTIDWYKNSGKLTKAKNEHIADALAVLEAYIKGEGL